MVKAMGRKRLTAVYQLSSFGSPLTLFSKPFSPVFSSTFSSCSSLPSLSPLSSTINRLVLVLLIAIFTNHLCLVRCQSDEVTTPSSLTLTDPSEVTTGTFLNLIISTVPPTTLSPKDGQSTNSTASSSSTMILDLSTNASLIESSENNEVGNTTLKPSNPSRVTAFLDESDEVNTQSSTITIDVSPIILNNVINQTEFNYSISDNTSLPIPVTFQPKSPLLKSPSVNSTVEQTLLPNQSLIDSPTTLLTVDLVNGNANNSNDDKNNNIIIISNETSSQTRAGNETICDSNRLEIDHYQAKKFFLLTMILLGFCCFLIIIVLILVVYIYRKLSKEKTVKVPNNVGAVEFDTIKDGRFHQWQGTVNSAFDSADLNDATTRTGYRFMDGSVIPYSERYHTDIKSSSTETFGHHLNSHHHQNHPAQASFNNNSLPKTIDTRL
ncbi:integrator complex subunit 6 homolog [Tetranychus urticae]|uniref:integrator complex subunit 6 homolog n=1 Tax=Tetranychus urticae TaxID=32264 RepID=UPI00077BC780|nr:integrator complex subunit 6 homolog [Tetranychus urticae]